MDGRQPSKLADVFGVGGLRLCIELMVLFCSYEDALPQHWSVLRAIHTLNNPEIKYPLARGVVDHPFNAMDWSARSLVGH
jgi:hypothetical protein